jgi:hypothetical protein
VPTFAQEVVDPPQLDVQIDSQSQNSVRASSSSARRESRLFMCYLLLVGVLSGFEPLLHCSYRQKGEKQHPPKVNQGIRAK